MSFSERLLDSSDRAESAFVRYVTIRNKDDWKAVAFVEDEDDIDFYQCIVPESDDIFFIKCGGRDGVIKLSDRIGDQHCRKAKLLFFVDRDSNSKDSISKDICCTSTYSWESQCCLDGALGSFLRRQIDPPLDVQELAQLKALWDFTLQQFSVYLRRQFILIFLSDKFRLDLKATDLLLARDCVETAGAICPNSRVNLELAGIESSLDLTDEIQQSIIVAGELFDELGPLSAAHGKSLYRILRSYLSVSIRNCNRRIRCEISSAKIFVQSIEREKDCFNYIREYVALRCKCC